MCEQTVKETAETVPSLHHAAPNGRTEFVFHTEIHSDINFIAADPVFIPRYLFPGIFPFARFNPSKNASAMHSF